MKNTQRYTVVDTKSKKKAKIMKRYRIDQGQLSLGASCHNGSIEKRIYQSDKIQDTQDKKHVEII